MSITFDKLGERDYKGFCDDVKEIFSIAAVEAFGPPKDGREIIPTMKSAVFCKTLCVRHMQYMLTV